MTTKHFVIRDRLSRFLIISIVLHLCLIAGSGPSSPVVPNRQLGQPVLDVQLQDYAPAPAARLLSHAASSLPVTKASGINAVMQAETSEGPSPSAFYTDTQPGVSVSTTEEPQQGLRNQLLGELKTRLSHYLTYPSLARKHGWEGTVLLGLRVEPDGQLDRIRLERSSGYAVLDNSALNSLQRIGKLAEARAWPEGRSVDLQLPVIYRLIEN